MKHVPPNPQGGNLTFVLPLDKIQISEGGLERPLFAALSDRAGDAAFGISANPIPGLKSRPV